MPHRVLVVDDEEAIRSLVKDYLEERGYRVDCAPDGDEGIKTFQKAHPHVVLIDFLLPRKNGFAVAEAIRKDETHPDTPIIMMSGVFKNPKTAVEAREKYRVLDFLSKPLDMSRIASLVEGVIAHVPADDEADGGEPDPQPLEFDALKELSYVDDDDPPTETESEPEPAPAPRSRGSAAPSSRLSAPPTPAPTPARPKTAAAPRSASKASGPAVDIFRGRPLPELLEEGEIEFAPVAQLLAILRYDELTGMLDLTEQATHRRIYVVRGLPTFMQSNAEGENVGALLLRRGRITEPDFQRCLAYMKQKGRTLQQSLLDLRLANEHDLSTAYKLLAGQLLPLALGMTTGGFKWRETDAFIGRVPEGNFEPVQVMFDGIKRHVHPPQILRFFKGREDVPLQRTSEFEKLMPFFRRAFSANNIASEVSGKATYREITRRHGSEAASVVPQLYALVTSGMAVLPELNEENLMDAAVNAAAAEIASLNESEADQAIELGAGGEESPGTVDERRARAMINRFYDEIMAKDFFQIFGVGRDGDQEKIKGAYFELAKKWHADTYGNMDLGNATPKLDAIFQRITEAYETITDKKKRDEYLVFIDRQAKGLPTDVGEILRGEQLYDQAVLLIRRHDYAGAVAMLEDAIQRNPGDALYTAQLGWATFHLHKKDQPEGTEAIAILKRALEENSRCALAYQLLGQVFYFGNQLGEAKRVWKKCLEYEPANIEATRGLRMLNQREDKDRGAKSGLFSKFLNKK